MNIESGFTQLIQQARLGDRGALDCLAETARQRLYAYIYRLTLNHDLAQDLLQETLLKMVENIEDLKHPEGFWSWLFRTALGNVQHYYRDLARAQRIELSARSRDRLSKYLSEDHDDGLNRLMRKELCEAVVKAMGQLTLTYRNILSLRCFEQMSYAEIADMMGCKELRARVLFFRAKRSLTRRLARRGFSKGLLLAALGLFGTLTAPAESAPAGTVTAASLHVGPLASFAGIAGTPPGVAVVAAITGAGFTLTTEHFVYFAMFAAIALISFVVALCFD
jgi:RNA polymerase sigma-70 factor (ECF subfamily)